ncbi:PfkB family carbohydrate kinase, partial [Rhizobium brockwellii]|uniref:PfkB family carbohydrate kinase n=1 Tax=Rhizobium brockwellii TaxID=3019932 RepID=UPI003F9D881B
VDAEAVGQRHRHLTAVFIGDAGTIEDGAVILKGRERFYVDAIRIREVVDTTGAGDLFASGFPDGYTHGRSLEDCGKLGCLAAGIVIQQIGPRPMTSLSE